MNLNLTNIISIEIMPRHHGKLVCNENMYLDFCDVEKDAVTPLHEYIHEQIMYVLKMNSN